MKVYVLYHISVMEVAVAAMSQAEQLPLITQCSMPTKQLMVEMTLSSVKQSLMMQVLKYHLQTQQMDKSSIAMLQSDWMLSMIIMRSMLCNIIGTKVVMTLIHLWIIHIMLQSQKVMESIGLLQEQMTLWEMKKEICSHSRSMIRHLLLVQTGHQMVPGVLMQLVYTLAFLIQTSILLFGIGMDKLIQQAERKILFSSPKVMECMSFSYMRTTPLIVGPLLGLCSILTICGLPQICYIRQITQNIMVVKLFKLMHMIRISTLSGTIGTTDQTALGHQCLTLRHCQIRGQATG